MNTRFSFTGGIFAQSVLANFFVIITTGVLSAQRFEFGGGVGMLHYRGDLNPTWMPVKPSVAAEVFGRYNLSMAAVLRAGILFAPSVAAFSSDSPDPYFNSSPEPYGFSTYLAELSVMGEYNFFNYRSPKNRFVFGSPYLFGGLGLSMAELGEPDNFQPDSLFLNSPIPAVKYPANPRISLFPVFVLGVGYKQQLGQYFNLGVQASGRFLFSDHLDQVSDREQSYSRVKNPDGTFAVDANGNFINQQVLRRQLGNKSDRDSYFYIGVSLSYTIKEIICPFKYEKKQDK